MICCSLRTLIRKRTVLTRLILGTRWVSHSLTFSPCHIPLRIITTFLTDFSLDSTDSGSHTPRDRAGTDASTPRRTKKRSWSNLLHATNIPPTTRKLISILQQIEKKSSEMRIFSYMNYDKQRSVAYFAVQLARLMTCGNLHSLRRLVRMSCTKYCQVRLNLTSGKVKIDLETFNDFFTVTRDLHPDSVLTCDSTAVVGNTVTCELTYKYTDAPEMYAYLDFIVTNPTLKVLFSGTRSDMLSRKLKVDTMTDGDKKSQLLSMVEAEVELQLSIKMHLFYRFDAVSRKITYIEFNSKVESVSRESNTVSLDV